MKRLLQIMVVFMTFTAFNVYAAWVQSGPLNMVTVFEEWPDDPDTTSSTINVLVPRAEINVVTGTTGLIIVLFCGDVGFGPPGAATDVGAMTIELFIDGNLMKPGTTMFAQNVDAQNQCATFMDKVKAGPHVIQVYWRSLGGEQMFMGFRTLTILHR
ncbi:MAG TPA: hypothetical protein VLH08_07470 [Acidobacteriota bacterium]|nr:hypothetical protein [Acidobacteriota bacterium]